MGAFHSTPLEPLHQLTSIPPIQIQLQCLTTQVATCLLTLLTSSPVLQRLGPPWSMVEGSGIPLPYPTRACQPDMCIRQLCKHVPIGSRTPQCFNQPLWRHSQPPPGPPHNYTQPMSGQRPQTFNQHNMKHTPQPSQPAPGLLQRCQTQPHTDPPNMDRGGCHL
jgi:hypothetical protein